ncbi:MAG: YitT family protein [Flavobacteriales bacterium]
MIKENLKFEFINYIFMTLGSFLCALGVVGFLVPNKIATGGTAGLAIILHHLLNLPTGILMSLINLPLLLVSFKYLGKTFVVKSIICIILITLFVDLLAEIVQLPNLSEDLMLATLYGGILVGLGIGFIFKGGGSAGGATILAKLVTSRFDLKAGTVILFFDSIVIFTAGYVFKSVELALWSLISIYVTSKLIDTILTGNPRQKIIHIASFKNLSDLSILLNDQLKISGTLVKGKDLELKEYKHLLFVVVDRNQLSILKNIVHQYDSNARMIVMEASEILKTK